MLHFLVFDTLTIVLEMELGALGTRLRPMVRAYLLHLPSLLLGDLLDVLSFDASTQSLFCFLSG